MLIKAIYFDHFDGAQGYYMVTLKHLEQFKEEDLTMGGGESMEMDGMMGKLLEGLMGGGSGGLESLLGGAAGGGSAGGLGSLLGGDQNGGDIQSLL